jgi:RNA polymerase sigma-70 factor, ECF subfamily
MSIGVAEGPSDTALVLAVARRKEDALRALYDRHSGSVLALARRLTGSDDLAAEVVQEIFVRLWNGPDRFDPDRGSLRSFLLADAHGRSVDLVRSEVARRRREERDFRESPAVEHDTPESDVLAAATSNDVREALAALPDGERRAIELAYFSGYSYREVAEILGEPAGTVKSRIRAGLTRLRETLVAGVTLLP